GATARLRSLASLIGRSRGSSRVVRNVDGQVVAAVVSSWTPPHRFRVSGGTPAPRHLENARSRKRLQLRSECVSSSVPLRREFRRDAIWLRVAVCALAQAVAAHDLQQAGVIRQPERLGGPRDVPIVCVERVEDDLAFGLRLLRLQCPGGGARISGVVAVVTAAKDRKSTRLNSS